VVLVSTKNGVRCNTIIQSRHYRIDSLRALSNIPISGNSGSKEEILANFTTVAHGSERAVISHRDVQPGSTSTVPCSTATGRNRRRRGQIIEENCKGLPKSSQLIVRGRIQTMKSSFKGLLYGLAFASLLVHLLMVVNFQSWLDPFIGVGSSREQRGA